MKVMEQLGLTRRQKVLGLPIGPRRTDWRRVAGLGAAAASTTAAGAGVARRARGSGNSLRERGKEAVERTRELGEEGRQAMPSTPDLGERMSAAQEAASTASTPIGKAAAAAKALTGSGDRQTKKQRLIIQEQIDIAVPRQDVYDQWTQFENFPTFFHAVEEVDQEEDETLTWQAKVLASRRTWKAEIVEQIPDQRIVWQSTGDVKHRGVVTFHELDDHLTRVQVEMEYEPTGVVEKVGNLFLTVRHRVRKDLRLFKHHLEFENEATGAWRGEIHEGRVQHDGEGRQQGDEETGRDEAREGGQETRADEHGQPPSEGGDGSGDEEHSHAS